MDNMKKITRLEVETGLAKLLFYTKVSVYYEPYLQCRDIFEKILNIVEKWLTYYATDGDLSKMTDDEAKSIIKLVDEIPVEAYCYDYYEEIENWVDIVIYYGSCPLNEAFDESKITLKGKNEKDE